MKKENNVCPLETDHTFYFTEATVNTCGILESKSKLGTKTNFWPTSFRANEHTMRITFICHRCGKQDIEYIDITKFIQDMAIDFYSKPRGRYKEHFDAQYYLDLHKDWDDKAKESFKKMFEIV